MSLRPTLRYSSPRPGALVSRVRALVAGFVLLFAAVAIGTAGAVAIDQPLEFENERQEEQYYRLTQKLRCTVCQSETIYESGAKLAADMRERVYEMTVDGHSEEEIIDYMTRRYGDYVLYKPPFQLNTALLWVSPFLLLIIGGVTWLQVVRRRRAVETELTESERRALERFRRGDS